MTFCAVPQTRNVWLHEGAGARQRRTRPAGDIPFASVADGYGQQTWTGNLPSMPWQHKEQAPTGFVVSHTLAAWGQPGLTARALCHGGTRVPAMVCEYSAGIFSISHRTSPFFCFFALSFLSCPASISSFIRHLSRFFIFFVPTKTKICISPVSYGFSVHFLKFFLLSFYFFIKRRLFFILSARIAYEIRENNTCKIFEKSF